MEQQNIREITPNHFRQECMSAVLIDGSIIHSRFCGAPDLGRTDFAKGEMWGQAGCAGFNVWPVSVVFVTGDRSVEKIEQAFNRARFARARGFDD